MSDFTNDARFAKFRKLGLAGSTKLGSSMCYFKLRSNYPNTIFKAINLASGRSFAGVSLAFRKLPGLGGVVATTESSAASLLIET